MSDNYPETLAVKIFANVPGWGETIFNIVCLWLSEETKQKFIVVSKANTPRVLAERIGPDNIPAKFVVSKSESLVDEVNSAPEPQTAHENPAENQPEPTDTVTDADSKQMQQLPPGDTERISFSASSPPLPSPPQPAVTAAPASPSSKPKDLEDMTAGMRIDDKTENQEPEATAAPMP
ncbi:Non-classical phosphatidylinositol transfer protein (PITP) [Kickxella alabastrina]|uniref:Non-classical phosphatidylinositol transfer protein (PITP) n=1 Tax=Kickxella alabastrina TaxID=61397 RepID=A0ACC1ID25_9FUNG|nr:Non-classical phosphatidylinositol transfer protein (PITP) [Kickxella alabastrina]